MYGIPLNSDLTRLVSQKIESICIERFSIVLHCSNGFEITIECRIQVDFQDVHYNSLSEWINLKIYALTISDNRRLDIYFDNGKILSLLDSNENYESFRITGPGVDLIV